MRVGEGTWPRGLGYLLATSGLLVLLRAALFDLALAALTPLHPSQCGQGQRWGSTKMRGWDQPLQAPWRGSARKDTSHLSSLATLSVKWQK